MQRLRWLAVLMGITILGLTGFQLYWLQQTYTREKKTLGIKTDVSFKETMLHLQASKLNLSKFRSFRDTLKQGKVKIFMSDGIKSTHTFTPSREEMISSIKVIRERMKDSLPIKGGVMISMDKDIKVPRHDTVQFDARISGGGQTHDYIFNFLSGVDSLQDSLKVIEIDRAYKKTLEREKLNVPFNIMRLDSCCEEAGFNEVTVGFLKPVTYRLELGNTFPYLLKRISAPILFSVLLMGITILSFVLLYRNLLRQQRLAALKNEFISNITHELQTPIATVGVAIEALKNFNAIQDPKRTKEYLDISSNELQRLSLLVDKVLKLSMFEKQEIDLTYEPVNLKEIVDEVTDSLRLQLEKNEAKVSVTYEGSTSMQGDKLHLQSVIFNLLDNAIKYSKGDALIQIHLQEQPETIEMTIADNGIGIPTEYKDKIFDKFFRVPHGDTHNAKGYGLGLSYVAHVVQKHQGKIELDTQPGMGTKFIISLPKAVNG